MKNLIKVLKNKFIKLGKEYKEITDTVIGLELSIDMIAYGNTIYFFNNSGEKIFNMERAYKTVCKEKIEEIKDMGIVSDIESFMNVANSGHNPKKFISFNKENLKLLKNDKMKDSISIKFNIPLINGKFDTTNDEVSKKLIKLLCDKGKIDPFNNKPVEVAGAKEWKQGGFLMTSINSWCLYYVSFVPLWLAILFIDIKNIVEKKQNLYTEAISIIAIIVLFIISLIIVRRIIIDKRRSGAEKYTIMEAKKSKDITIEYFLAYVLPLFAFDFTQWDQLIIFLIFYLSLGFL